MFLVHVKRLEMSTPAITSFRGKNRYLSNFADVAEGCVNGVEYRGVVYQTSEHAYQAAKFLHLPAIAELVRLQPTPGKTKYVARQYKARIRPDWHEVKFEVMREILRSKFERNPELAAQLVGTGDAELVEVNNWGDVVWGVCKGVGENWLGKLLMERRAAITQPADL